MANVKLLQTRISHKHDTPEAWQSADLIPLDGELIIYDYAEPDKKRIKIGDGIHVTDELPFITPERGVDYWTDADLAELDIRFGNLLTAHDTSTSAHADIRAKITELHSYILDIDYETILAFDTSEIIIGETASSTTSMLGKAILGKLILG